MVYIFQGFRKYSSTLLTFSLGQEVLSCILEIVDVPAIGKDAVIGENDFERILDWCDVWIILLKMTGTSPSELFQRSKFFFFTDINFKYV